MATYTKVLLSGSTNGKPIKISATSSTGDTIHQAPNNTTGLDEIWLWAVNTGTATVKLTIEWGTTTAADGNLELNIPGESGLYAIAPGLLLNNNLLVTAFAGTTAVILIHGFVNRIDP